jgi:hypothetical protein
MKKTNHLATSIDNSFVSSIRRRSKIFLSMGCIVLASVFNYGCHSNEPETSSAKEVTLEEKLTKDEAFDSYLIASSEFTAITLDKVSLMNDEERADYLQKLQKLSNEPMNDQNKDLIASTLGFQDSKQFEALYNKLTIERNKLLAKHPSLNKLDEGQRKDLFLKVGVKENLNNIVFRPLKDRGFSNMRTNGPNCGTCKPEKDNCRRQAGGVYALSIAAGLTGCVVAGPFYEVCVAGVYAAATAVLNSQINQCEINYTRCVNNECK